MKIAFYILGTCLFTSLSHGPILGAEPLPEPLRGDYSEPGPFSEGLARFYTNDWPRAAGFVNAAGEVLIPPTHARAEFFSDGLAAVCAGEDWVNCKWGYIDRSGQLVIAARFETAEPFKEGLALVRESFSEPWGYLTRSGDYAISPTFPSARGFSEGLAAVATGTFGTQWGYIDATGTPVIEMRYEDAQPFSEGLAWVREDGRYGAIDASREGRIAPRFADVRSFREGVAAVSPDGLRWGLIDKQGEWLAPARYAAVGDMCDGLAWFQSEPDGPHGYLDRSGKPVLEPVWLQAQSFSEGLAWVLIPCDDQNGMRIDLGNGSGRWGAIDRSGTLVIGPHYTDCLPFSEGFAAVESAYTGQRGFVAHPLAK